MAKTKKKNDTAANLGFEAKLWLAADKLRGSMDAAEYKHVVLGLIFLKYVSDSFLERREWLDKAVRDSKSDYFTKRDDQRQKILEDRDEYAGENVFWVPLKARWSVFQEAHSSTT